MKTSLDVSVKRRRCILRISLDIGDSELVERFNVVNGTSIRSALRNRCRDPHNTDCQLGDVTQELTSGSGSTPKKKNMKRSVGSCRASWESRVIRKLQLAGLRLLLEQTNSLLQL